MRVIIQGSKVQKKKEMNHTFLKAQSVARNLKDLIKSLAYARLPSTCGRLEWHMTHDGFPVQFDAMLGPHWCPAQNTTLPNVPPINSHNHLTYSIGLVHYFLMTEEKLPSTTLISLSGPTETIMTVATPGQYNINVTKNFQ